MAGLEHIDAIALAGGKGSRLLPVVSDVPKPLAKVAGRPVIEYVLDQLKSAGCRRVVLSLGHRADEIKAYFSARPNDELEVRTAIEPEPLDTGGGLRYALDQTETDEVLALNVDSYLDVELGELAGFKQRHAVPAALIAAKVADVSASGSLNIDESEKVRAFREKDPAHTGPGWINGGIYLMDRDVLASIPAGLKTSLERDVFPGLCDGRLAAMKREADFLDIGTPGNYAKADAFFAARQINAQEAQP